MATIKEQADECILRWKARKATDPDAPAIMHAPLLEYTPARNGPIDVEFREVNVEPCLWQQDLSNPTKGDVYYAMFLGAVGGFVAGGLWVSWLTA